MALSAYSLGPYEEPPLPGCSADSSTAFGFEDALTPATFTHPGQPSRPVNQLTPPSSNAGADLPTLHPPGDGESGIHDPSNKECEKCHRRYPIDHFQSRKRSRGPPRKTIWCIKCRDAHRESCRKPKRAEPESDAEDNEEDYMPRTSKHRRLLPPGSPSKIAQREQYVKAITACWGLTGSLSDSIPRRFWGGKSEDARQWGKEYLEKMQSLANYTLGDLPGALKLLERAIRNRTLQYDMPLANLPLMQKDDIGAAISLFTEGLHIAAKAPGSFSLRMHTPPASDTSTKRTPGVEPLPINGLPNYAFTSSADIPQKVYPAENVLRDCSAEATPIASTSRIREHCPVIKVDPDASGFLSRPNGLGGLRGGSGSSGSGGLGGPRGASIPGISGSRSASGCDLGGIRCGSIASFEHAPNDAAERLKMLHERQKEACLKRDILEQKWIIEQTEKEIKEALRATATGRREDPILL